MQPNSLACSLAHTHTHTLLQTRARTNMHTYALARTHTHMHARMHAQVKVVPCNGKVYGEDNLMFMANDWHTALLPVYLQVRSCSGHA